MFIGIRIFLNLMVPIGFGPSEFYMPCHISHGGIASFLEWVIIRKLVNSYRNSDKIFRLINTLVHINGNILKKMTVEKKN